MAASGAGATASNVAALTLWIWSKRMVPARKAATATSLAAFSTAVRARRAPRSASQASSRPGKRARVGARSKRERASVAKSSALRARFDALRARPGRRRSARACRACRAAPAPSRRGTRTIEWIDALRMDHDLDAARARRSNSQRASITSSALFIIVAESTEILRPITQFGMRAGLVGRDVAQRRRVAACGTARPRR